MPLGLLGGCANRCGACEGCFGSFSIQGCKLAWSTSGDPYAVEIRSTTQTLSRQGSGFLSNPPSGVYELWIRCAASDDWALIDTINWTQISTTICRQCCIESGAYASPPRYVRITCAGSFWSRFNGTYQLTPTLNSVGNPDPCSYTKTVTFPYSNPSPVSAVGYCNSTGGWVASGWRAGSLSWGPCPASGYEIRVYDVYWIPTQIRINLVYASSFSGSGLSLDVTLEVASFWLRTSSSSSLLACWAIGRGLETVNGAVPGYMIFQPNVCGTLSGSLYQEFSQVTPNPCSGPSLVYPVPSPLDMIADVLP